MKNNKDNKVDLEFGETVYLKTDPDQFERLVSGKISRPGVTLWELCCGTCVSSHYGFEILQKNVVSKKVGFKK